MTRRLDLLDRMEPGGLDRRAERRSRRRAPRDRPPPRRSPLPRAARRPPPGAPPGPPAASALDRARPAREVRAAAADDRPRTGQRQRPPTVVIDQEPRPPARAAPMLGPRPRLVDVAAGRLDRAGIPVLELVGLRVADVQSAAPYAAALPPVADPAAPARPLDADPLGEFVGPPAERAEDQVPRPDVPDLATPEAGLEMGDPAGREAPQVVARGAGLARRADGLPLEQVVGARLAAGRGHPAVRLDDARAGPHQEERRLRLAIRRSARTAAGRGRSGRTPPTRRGRRIRPGSGSRPGPRSRGRSGRTRRAGRHPRRPR